jgi:leucyl aminopeptidase
MKINLQHTDILDHKCDLLFVGIFQEVLVPSGPAGAVNEVLGGLIADLIKDKEIKGDLGKVTIIHSQGKLPAKRIGLVGLGKPEKFNIEDLREAGAAMVHAAWSVSAKNIATVIHGVGLAGIYPKEAATTLLEGILLGGYKYPGIKSKQAEQPSPIEKLTFVDYKEEQLKGLKPELDYIQIRSECVNKARDLVNLSANIATPTYLAEKALDLAKEYKSIKVKVLERKDLEKMKAGAFLSVSAGATEPPKMIIIEYNERPQQELIALLGKGITFDSGGIDLKPGKKMGEMKTDMAGAAAVLEIMEAVARLKLKINVVGIIPATENMPSGSATRPGDIITALSGKTIEIISTDAEGRMVLADAITYARQNGAAKLIDLATLTGGVGVALGEVRTGVMGNDSMWIDEIMEAGSKAGEKLWQLPLDKDYKEQIKSEVADIANCTEDGKASPIIGGIFLQEFAKNLPWVHLDIAGTAYISRKIGCLPKGATGVGVRTVVELLKSKSES